MVVFWCSIWQTERLSIRSSNGGISFLPKLILGQRIIFILWFWEINATWKTERLVRRRQRSFSSRNMDWLILRSVPRMDWMLSLPSVRAFLSFTSITNSRIFTPSHKLEFLFLWRPKKAKMDAADNLLILKLTIKIWEKHSLKISEGKVKDLRKTNFVHKPQITKEKSLFHWEHLQVNKLEFSATHRVLRHCWKLAFYNVIECQVVCVWSDDFECYYC